MPEKHAIIVAVEDYQDGKIQPVRFATNDAEKLATGLETVGFEKQNMTVLLNSDATKTRLESVFRNRFGALESDDQIVFFYAGHGFADVGRNYITCHDTVLADLVKTSIEMQSLFEEIRQSKSERALFLLDCCHSGLPIDECMRSILSDMTDGEFEAFCGESSYNMALASSATDEVSHASSKLKHGVWSYHVIEALNGRAPKALERGRYLTVSSLQNYLNAEVPRTLRKTIAGAQKQTPKSWGNLSREAILADLNNLLASRKAASQSALASLKRASLMAIEEGTVRSLKGFEKHHRVPNQVNSVTSDFVKHVGMPNVADLADDLYEKMKQSFRYKRKDLEVSDDDGSKSIVTPDFTVNVWVDIDDEDSEGYVFVVEVTDIRRLSVLETEEFSQVFDRVFDRVVFELDARVSIEDLVDSIEDVDDEDLISVNYPSDLSYCEVKIAGLDGTLHVTVSEVSLVQDREVDVLSLLEECRELPSLLAEHGVAGLLPASRT